MENIQSDEKQELTSLEISNRIITVGEVVSEAKFSHETCNEKFYTFMLKVKRLSGDADTLEVLISDKIMELELLKVGNMIKLEGEIRSYNYYIEEESRRKLIVTIFAKNISLKEEKDDETTNDVELIGYICKKPGYRKTPFGREIADILVAVNRVYGKSDYLPCIAWGRNAKYAESLNVGEIIDIRGRLQSREYTKKYDENNSATKVAYEVSISSLNKREK